MAKGKTQSKKPLVKLTKEQQKQAQKRMSELKKLNMGNKSATQSVIPYVEMFPDGICYLEDNRFSRTVEFFDTNYEIANLDEKNSIFNRWSSLINYFDENIDFQFSYENQHQNIDDELQRIRVQSQNDDFNAVRNEYSDMLCELRLNSKSGFFLRKFLTFTVSEKSLKSARRRLDSIGNDIVRLFNEINVKAVER